MGDEKQTPFNSEGVKIFYFEEHQARKAKNEQISNSFSAQLTIKLRADQSFKIETTGVNKHNAAALLRAVLKANDEILSTFF
jgi:hypothetical protein